MASKKQAIELIPGQASHRRTEADYMGVLLEAVTLDDWRVVVNNAKKLAQAGDPQARAWLAQFLMGKPAGSAPTPLTVVVQQLNGADPVVNKLVAPAIRRFKFPVLEGLEKYENEIRALISAELEGKIRAAEAIESPSTVQLKGEGTVP